MLRTLSLTSFRNYRTTVFEPGVGVNLVYGSNGSGKSSLLEAAYMLGSGRSFRTSKLRRLVNEDADETVLYAEIISPREQLHRVGLSRNRQGITGIKMDGNRLRGLSELARVLPVQVFQPGTVEMVEGPSSARRRYLDWGLFHVEHSFLMEWRALSSAVQQRNRLLKQPMPDRRELVVWSQQVAAASARIDQLRRAYLGELMPLIQTACRRFPELPEMTIELQSGWIGQDEESLQIQLEQDIDQDRRRGFTGRGAHRAELKIVTSAGPAREVLSRGQGKILSYVLLLAQLDHMVRTRGQPCLVLVDDLASELDRENRKIVADALLDLGQQTIFTALHADQLAGELGENVRMFHVEHGVLTRVQ